jgi:hypothetical protein
MLTKFLDGLTRWADACDLKNYEIAALAKVPECSMRNFRRPKKHWNPTLKTLLALEAVVPEKWWKS